MFKMKLLAGVAAVALSGAVNAGIVGSSTGNTELVLTAYVGDVGYTYDLADAGFNSIFGSNVKIDSLIGNGNQTSYSTSAAPNGAQLTNTKSYLANDFSTGIVFDAELTGFASFLTLAGGADGVLWNVWTGESSGVRRIIQTVSSTPTDRVVTSAINTAVQNFGFYTDANSQGGTHNNLDVEVDGYRITTVEDLTAFAGNVAPRLNGAYNSFGSIGDTLDMYVVRGASPTSNTARGGFAQLLGMTDQAVTARVYVGDQGEYRLQISAVPEPETYAMLLAGLGLIGFAARRRRA
ncbi:PEP-CTERM -sorting domain protein [Methyloversatilis sp. RAC08]|uniref:FxDxF family PEP-CTERM protein n=1 Tax=Methyloversatilis sp. RAC08 TaxID=1842540 RepID=UPI00083E347F|nr:FxDxF family PEP-CTERM protein [Methyloversatilis sp. RAC08]AOF81424.1 PEP-CTERM -sorting domain protein [Methyloversatilis sp. RAC08]